MIGIKGSSFVDDEGRTLLLRGVNLGGSSKVPVLNPSAGSSIGRTMAAGHRQVSFVGRPFPLEESEEHLRRLQAWGCTFLRLLVPWEAVEHAGPGIYDEAFLDYLRSIIERARRHGISVLIDPHQDMWSRFSGGDGAPGWTLEAAGFDLEHLESAGAAVTYGHYGPSMPSVIWVSNGGKLAAATMFTLFFGGNDFAPRTTLDGAPIQDFLQEHYCQAYAAVARSLRDLPNVAGYGVMNEPLCGYIGWGDLRVPQGQLTLGEGPTPFQGMLLGSGIPQEVAVWSMRTIRIRRTGTRLLNPGGVRAWREGFECVWRDNGVWELDGSGSPVLARPEHFLRARGRRVDFAQDYLRPFAEKFYGAIRDADPRAIIFLEAEASAAPPRWDRARFPQVAHAPHWYDELTLARNRYNGLAGVEQGTHRLVLGRWRVDRAFREQLQRLRQLSEERVGGAPTLLAEFGIPFGMHSGRAYRTGNFTRQIQALDRSYRAIEATLMSHTLWNYTADNSNEQGDQWNGEDLSIFSRDQQTSPEEIDSGGRALEAFVRPWPRATAGRPLAVYFNRTRREFRYEFRHDPGVSAPTEIYLPRRLYPRGCRIEVSDGSFDHRPSEQLLLYRHSSQRSEHWIAVTAVHA